MCREGGGGGWADKGSDVPLYNNAFWTTSGNNMFVARKKYMYKIDDKVEHKNT